MGHGPHRNEADRRGAIENLRLVVADLDAIDGSPVLDVKPWVHELGPRGDTRQPDWMTALMKDYF